MGATGCIRDDNLIEDLRHEPQEALTIFRKARKFQRCQHQRLALQPCIGRGMVGDLDDNGRGVLGVGVPLIDDRKISEPMRIIGIEICCCGRLQ